MEKFKRANVILIKSLSLQRNCVVLENNKLRIAESLSKDLFNTKTIPQHLYITTDEEIKEGELMFDSNFKTITTNKGESKTYLKNWCVKIIASTDDELKLPKPSQQFIEKYIEQYNNGKPITEVLVEYQSTSEWYFERSSGYGGYRCDNCGTWIYENQNKICQCDDKLKVNQKDNTITIKRIKNTFTREEIEKAFELGFKYNETKQEKPPMKFLWENL